VTPGSALVCSLNPSVDAEWRIDACVVPDDKNEVVSESRRPGGKGVNVARWMHWLGRPARLLAALDGPTGDEIESGLRAEGVCVDRIPLGFPNRVNVIVTPAGGPQYRFNPMWSRIDRAGEMALRSGVAERIPEAPVTVLTGALPAGSRSDFYAAMVREARRRRRLAAVDADGAILKAAVKARPWLVKPNEGELARWVGRELRTEKALRAAAIAMSEETGGLVFLSRGGAGGWLVNAPERSAWVAIPPPVKVRNAVGAGDAALAGFLAECLAGGSVAECLAAGVAAGTAATQAPVAGLPSRATWRRIRAAVRVGIALEFFARSG
jgi:1-phosphofructokinase family hexose kinase